MVASSPQPLPAEPAATSATALASRELWFPARRPVAARRASRPIQFLPLSLGFFACLPYPAMPVGGSSAIQVGNLLAVIACLPLVLAHRPATSRPYWTYAACLAPLLLSTVNVAIGGQGDVATCFKAIPVWAVSALAMTATQRLTADAALDLFTGVAAATLLHAGVGLWQWYNFSNGVFPFDDLYVNPSFLSVQDNATTIARYVRRPFGLFPEPSAMSASLAPFVLLWTAERLGLMRLRAQTSPWQRKLFGAAAVGGLALIILSQSGHAATVLAALLVFAAVWLRRSRATWGTFLTVLLAVGAVLPAVLYFGAEALGERVGGKSALGNSSWEERSESLVMGFQLMLDGGWPAVLFGMGAGLSSPALWNAARIDAVFSVSLSYLYETGVVGLLAIAAVGAHLARIWRAAGFDLVLIATLLVWLVGVTLTTSYEQLLPLWLALGWLTVWPVLCAPASSAEAASAMTSRAAPPSYAPDWRHLWRGE